MFKSLKILSLAVFPIFQWGFFLKFHSDKFIILFLYYYMGCRKPPKPISWLNSLNLNSIYPWYKYKIFFVVFSFFIFPTRKSRAGKYKSNFKFFRSLDFVKILPYYYITLTLPVVNRFNFFFTKNCGRVSGCIISFHNIFLLTL